MNDATHSLNELEYDLLTELFNIGVGRAAASLGEMLNQEIQISVPEISFCTVNELLRNFDEHGDVISISQEISGPFDMQSMLIFPTSGSNEVIRSMLGNHLTDEMATELQQEAFTEIGNIILNACIGIIAKTLDENFVVDLPHFSEDQLERIFIDQLANTDQMIMSMRVDLILTSSAISGYIAFVLGSVSMERIRAQLNKMLTSI